MPKQKLVKMTPAQKRAAKGMTPARKAAYKERLYELQTRSDYYSKPMKKTIKREKVTKKWLKTKPIATQLKILTLTKYLPKLHALQQSDPRRWGSWLREKKDELTGDYFHRQLHNMELNAQTQRHGLWRYIVEDDDRFI
jgi:hypothetical protein